MRLDQLQAIAEWNIVRHNVLDTVDFELEARMLAEEKREFYLAHDTYMFEVSQQTVDTILDALTEMADAIADYQFVYGGTVAKISRAKTTITDMQHSAMLAHAVQNELNLMIQLFMDAIASYGQVNLDECLDYVIEANEAKGVEKVDGKIQKGPDWVDPKSKIRAYLAEQLTIADV